jgi:aryl-phospho-beta-D-glucosidase BglC (GH1 family)
MSRSMNRWMLMVGILAATVLMATVLGSGLLARTGTNHHRTDGVSQARYERLSRGMNVPSWFNWGPDDPAEILKLFPTAQLEGLQRMGFDYVRVPVNLWLLLDRENPDVPRPAAMAALHTVIERILATGLAVTVDLHTVDEGKENLAWGKMLERDDAFVDVYVKFWRGFASELSRHDPERTFLELMNEPEFWKTPERWTKQIQPRIAAAAREGAPRHTIIATAPRNSWPVSLVDMEPLPDPNVVYTFHYYDPFVFTHQGFKGGTLEEVVGLRYPADMGTIYAMLDKVTAEQRFKLVKYGLEQWDRRNIERDIATVVEWRDRYGVRVICNEFGVIRNTAPRADRIVWFRDVRMVFEDAGIGWAMWEYGGWFGLFASMEPSARPDPELVQALGLRLPD